MRILFFAVVSISINALFGYYVWRRLVHDTWLRRPLRAIATWAIVVGQLLVPATMAAARFGATALVNVLAWPAFLWMGLFGLTLVALLVVDLGRLVVFVGRRALRRPRLDLERRALLAKITGGAAVAVAAGEVAIGMRNALGDHEVVDVPVTLERLPAAFDGFTIVQITDIHVGLTVGEGFVADIVRRVNQLHPDLIVLTGDLVDGRVADIGSRLAPLADLVAPHGVYSITGNHEYYSGVDEWIAQLGLLGIPTLRNQRVEIARGGEHFYLAGIDDHGAADFGKGHGPNLAEALAGRDPARAVVLLAHQPRQVEVAARQDVCLQLSGHTHGGQIFPWNYFVYLQQPVVAGLARVGQTLVYVSCGTGYWGPPMRLGAPAEITRIVLESNSPEGERVA